ncbi:hypothetical protein LINGRAHAP2_LOCUS15164 [Linum grandiflorum]
MGLSTGIPLHLRSKDLFRSVGNFCGQFLCSDEGRNLDYVRIKIRAKAVIPEEIPLWHGEMVFPIRISLEAPAPVSAGGNLKVFAHKWKNKSKGIVVSSEFNLSPPAETSTSSLLVGEEIGGGFNYGFTNMEALASEPDMGVREKMVINTEQEVGMRQDFEKRIGFGVAESRGSQGYGNLVGLKKDHLNHLSLLQDRWPDIWTEIGPRFVGLSLKELGCELGPSLVSIFKEWISEGGVCLSVAPSNLTVPFDLWPRDMISRSFDNVQRSGIQFPAGTSLRLFTGSGRAEDSF